ACGSTPIIGFEPTSLGPIVPVPVGGSETGRTGKTPVTPEIDERLPTCDSGTLTETPFHNVPYAWRCWTSTPGFFAPAKNASRSALTFAALPPAAVGDPASWTNQAVEVSLSGPFSGTD